MPFTFGNNNNNNLQFDMILNNEASVVESFLQIFRMALKYFSDFSIIPKSHWLVLKNHAMYYNTEKLPENKGSTHISHGFQTPNFSSWDVLLRAQWREYNRVFCSFISM